MKGFVIILFGLLSLQAQGQWFFSEAQDLEFASMTTTECIDEDCFTQGWESFGPNMNMRVNCLDEDCLNEGWRVFNYINGARTEVLCRRNGCFTQGWTEFLLPYGQRVSQARCGFGKNEAGEKEQNCLKYGWILESVNQPRQEIVCNENDCAAKGWSVFVGFRHALEVVCKSESCFEKGWRAFY